LAIAALPRSTFYAKQKKRPASHRQEQVTARINALFHQHHGRYGYRRLTLALQHEGIDINHKAVYRVMKQQGLASNLRPKKYQSYQGAYGKIAPNLLQRNVEATAPAQKWVTDVTQFNVKGQKLYLSPILDLYNREVIA
jgi:putative transposase